MRISLRTLPALALALVLSACGGGSVEPVTQKGFGPSQLYDPARNPTGRVLQEGDTGIVMLGGSGPQQVWFEIGEAATYGVELEDEDLATLGHLEIADGVTVTAMSLVTHSIREPGTYSSGTPIQDNRRWRRNAADYRRIDSHFSCLLDDLADFFIIARHIKHFGIH